MKQFFKSFLISFLIGIPLAAIIIVLLYIDKPDTPEGHQVQILYDKSDLTMNPEEILIPEEELQDSETHNEIHEEPPAQTPSFATLAFAGDVQFSDIYLSKYEQEGIAALADEEMLSYMQNADLFMLNNEFPFSLRGEPMEDKQFTFRTDPKYVSILQELGTDVVSVANNHVLDFGRESFLDTLDTLNEAEIAYAGGGYNYAEASSPVVRTINGQSFAIFAATRVSPSAEWYAGKQIAGIWQTYDATALNTAIAEAETQYDHTIVFIHWGIEKNETPEEYQRTLAKGYIDAGADLVIGCHPHVLQGFEYYKNVPIIYSLGNYLFGNRDGDTLLLEAEFAVGGELNIQLIPCKRIEGVLKSMENSDALYQHLTELSFDVTISESGVLIP